MSILKPKLANSQEETSLRSNPEAAAKPFMPVWKPKQYVRVTPGIYDATATRIVGPNHLRQHRRWSVGIEFQLCDIPSIRLVLFLNLADGNPSPGGDYVRYWTQANGASPQADEPMDPAVFLAPLRTYQIEVADSNRDQYGNPKPDGEVYSKAIAILAIVDSPSSPNDDRNSPISNHESSILNQKSANQPIKQSTGVRLEKKNNQDGPSSSDESQDGIGAPNSFLLSPNAEATADLLLFPAAKLTPTSAQARDKQAELFVRPQGRKMRSDAKQAVVERVFAHYCEKTQRNLTRCTLTPRRRQKGLVRLGDALGMTSGNLQAAEALMLAAVDGLTRSAWHMGQNPQAKRYLEWESHLFGTTENFENWLEDAQPPAAGSSDPKDGSNLIARAVLEGTGLNASYLYEAIRAQAEVELRKNAEYPDAMDRIRIGMIAAWKEYERCARDRKLKLGMMGAAKFFGEGKWKSQRLWFLKDGMKAYQNG